MSGSEAASLSSEIHYPPGSFHDRFSFSSESRPPTPVNVNAPINPVFENRTRRKVDGRLIPVLAVLYAIAFIDATNLAVARREGADKDFHLFHGHRYYFVSFVFFLPFIFLQLPLALALRRVGTALWLGTTIFLLGALQIALGFVNDWGQFLGVRLVLGILEAGILPSCVYLISSWYKRSEIQVRITLFYSASVLFGSFGNILALGMSKIHVGTLHGWRWIFALEGLVTVLLSFYGYSAVLPFPDRKHAAHAPFLSRDEIQLMRQRIELDRQDYVPDTLDRTKLCTYIMDMNLWTYAILALCANMAAYVPLYAERATANELCMAFLNLQPLFLQASHPSDDLSDVEVQLLSVPIGVVATAMVLLTGFISNRVGVLGPFLVFNFLLSTVGLSMTGFSGRRGVRFAGCFLAYSGAQGSIPIILSLAMNVRQHSKRIFTVSLVASFGSAGALLSVLAFPVSAAPNFTAGLRTALALQVAGAVIAGLLTARLRFENRVLGRLQLVEEEPRRIGGGETGTLHHGDLQLRLGASRTLQRLGTGRSRSRDVEGMLGFQYTA